MNSLETPDSLVKCILGRLPYDQLYFVTDLLSKDHCLTKQSLNELDCSTILDGISPIQLIILDEMSKDLYSPKICMGILLGSISVEQAVELSLAEEIYQLKSWPTLPDYHISNSNLLHSKIYYHLALLDIFKNAHSNV